MNRFNYYGLWEYNDVIPIGGGKQTMYAGDIIRIYRKKGDYVYAKAVRCKRIVKGRNIIRLHHTHILKSAFTRPC